MIALLTDFGLSEYVGVMKGVIHSIAPEEKIVDLCHDISPQSIIEASWILRNSYTFFPKGAIFCCVVDPGVGTDRRALAVKTDSFCFVAPDNGLLWETINEQKIYEMKELLLPQDASKTFHGRDVFAKAAANVSLGRFEELGHKTKSCERLQLYLDPPKGLIVRVDRFGNVITNLPRQNKSRYRAEITGKEFTMDFHDTYAEAVQNELFLIQGSCNTLEISLRNGNANDVMNVESGQRIKIS